MCIPTGGAPNSGPGVYGDSFMDPAEVPMSPAQENAIIEQQMRADGGAAAPFGAYTPAPVTSDSVVEMIRRQVQGQ